MLLELPPGLIFNFHELKLTDGVVRMILPRLVGRENDSTEASEGSEGEFQGIYRQIARKALLSEPGEDFWHSPPRGARSAPSSNEGKTARHGLRQRGE
jgi:hypothetical protein